jgi:hypothetical protein
MATEYLVQMAVTLTPKIGDAVPEVQISVPGYSAGYVLQHTKKIQLEFTADQGWLDILFFNKADSDATTAVIIDSIEFFGIADPKFVWAGTYRPDYPELWYRQQISTPSTMLTGTNYLGWNGRWRLDFGVPVFTWIHQTQNLGQIYQ